MSLIVEETDHTPVEDNTGLTVMTSPTGVQQEYEKDPWAPADNENKAYPGPGKPPIVSIILPAYNAHNTIKKTIASIAMQEGSEDIEVIIADDCSKYGYEKIAEQFAHMIRIRIVRMKKNGGPGAARQVGFDHSYGQYIMWMDADDTLVAADSIKTLVNVMEQQHMDCVYGKFLEENENGAIYPHEVHMVWMFGKLYRRSFIERYNIRFNTSLSNEDTGFNCVVKGCSDKVWYIPKDVYIWHFKANSITRIKQGMYGQDSGYKGWIDNMSWQILELQKRFVNRNYILSEIIGNMVTAYCFHEENLRNYPMNADISLNWCRGFYHTVYKPNEKYISQALFDQLAAQCLASHNIPAKGIIPSMTLKQFMREMRKPVEHLPNEETCGATPAGYIPPITSEDWPVEITDFYDRMEAPIDIDSDTNHSRYGGMKKAIGLQLSDEDYDMEYDGSQPIKTNEGSSIADVPGFRQMVKGDQFYGYTTDTGYYDMRTGCFYDKTTLAQMGTSIEKIETRKGIDPASMVEMDGCENGNCGTCIQGTTCADSPYRVKPDEPIMCPMVETIEEDPVPKDGEEGDINAIVNKVSNMMVNSTIDVRVNNGRVEIPADYSGQPGAPDHVYQNALTNDSIHKKFNKPFRP